MLIIADDLTGAADSAAAFAMRGHRSVVALSSQCGDLAGSAAAVLAIDTDGRARAEVEAIEATADCVRRHPGRAVFVKIDSTVRGHVLATVAAVVSALPAAPAQIVVCPAFPALGRTVVDGVVHVDGEPIEGGNLRELFCDFPGEVAPVLASARSDADLSALVRTMGDNVLWVGSAGLAAQLAARDGGLKTSTLRENRRSERIVVVVGSQHPRSIAQLAAIAGGVTVMRIDPRDETALASAHDALTAADGLVLTGGHTARAVLDLLGVEVLEVGGEVETGMPWSVSTSVSTSGSTSVATARTHARTIVTKAGGFGDSGSLQRAVAFLTRPY